MQILLQAEDGIRDLVRSRGLGDVYKGKMILVRQMVWLDLKPDKQHECFSLTSVSSRMAMLATNYFNSFNDRQNLSWF